MSPIVARGFVPFLLLGAIPALALELTFDPVERNFERINQAYGDRVTQIPQGGFSYGEEGGFTPNVEVGYGPIPRASPSLWTIGYGDLVNVLYEDADGFGHLEITFTADPRWSAALHGFDLAAYSVIDPINGWSVRNGAGTVLVSESDVAVPYPGHLSYSFDPPLEAATLVLELDSANLESQSDNVCVDNIVFSQVEAPLAIDPASWAGLKSLYR